MNSLEAAAGSAAETSIDSPAIALLPEAPRDLLTELNEANFRNTQLEATLQKKEQEFTKLKSYLDGLDANPFFLVISNHDGGALFQQLGEEFAHLCASVKTRQQAGKLALSIPVKPFQGTALNFAPQSTVTPPKPEPIKSLFFCDDDGGLSRNNKEQGELRF